MAIKPILFNTEMVKSILACKKTQTRRVVRFTECDVYDAACAEGMWNERYDPENPPNALIEWFVKAKARRPFALDDILWVRESWHQYEKRVGRGESCHLETFFGYRASIKNSEDASEPWKPSIHMPKEAARIFLRVKNVRVERLQDITVLNAINEGCCGTVCNHANSDPALGCTDCYDTGWLEPPDAEFALLWDATVNKTDLPVYGWDANPWVWAIEFERCEKPEGWCKK